MKVRQGFVSNSSSSSFVLDLEKVTPSQLRDLFKHPAIHTEKQVNEGEYAAFDEWIVRVEDDKLIGETVMNNYPIEYIFSDLNITEGFSVDND